MLSLICSPPPSPPLPSHSSPSPLCTLPTDLQVYIFQYLSPIEYISILSTHSTFGIHLTREYDILWKYYVYSTTFPCLDDTYIQRITQTFLHTNTKTNINSNPSLPSYPYRSLFIHLYHLNSEHWYNSREQRHSARIHNWSLNLSPIHSSLSSNRTFWNVKIHEQLYPVISFNRRNQLEDVMFITRKQ